MIAPFYSAARRGWNAAISARSAVRMGFGHQRSSQPACRSFSFGMTFSANSLVL